jgi:hypothetical protein
VLRPAAIPEQFDIQSVEMSTQIYIAAVALLDPEDDEAALGVRHRRHVADHVLAMLVAARTSTELGPVPEFQRQGRLVVEGKGDRKYARDVGGLIWKDSRAIPGAPLPSSGVTPGPKLSAPASSQKASLPLASDLALR